MVRQHKAKLKFEVLSTWFIKTNEIRSDYTVNKMVDKAKNLKIKCPRCAKGKLVTDNESEKHFAPSVVLY